MSSRNILFVFWVACLFAVFGRGAHGIAESPREALAALGGEVTGLLDAGGLERKAARAGEKLLLKIERAEAVDESDVARFLKRITPVMKKASRAVDLGLDLEERAANLDAAVAALVTGYRKNAEGLLSILAVEAHRKKVERLVESGMRAHAKADEDVWGGRRTRLHASAARKFLAAAGKGDLFVELEIESGDLALSVEEVLLDGSALVEGADLAEGEHGVEIRLNLPTDGGAVSPDAIVVEAGEGEEVEFFALLPTISTDEKTLAFHLPPLMPGEYALVVRGQDYLPGPWLTANYQITLEESVRIGFTISPAGE